MLHVHHEADWVSRSVTAEALTDVLRRRYLERSERLVVVPRTEAEITRSSLTQVHIVAHNIYDARSVPNLVNSEFIYSWHSLGFKIWCEM